MEQFIANGFCKGAVYALIALGFGLIYSTSRVFHLAHGAVYTLACYALYLLLIVLKLPSALSVLISLSVAAVAGLLMEAVVYGPLDKRMAPTSVLMISSLGVYIIIVNVLAACFGNETKVLRADIEKTVSFGNVILTQIQFVQVIVSICVICLYWLFLHKTSLGTLCRSVADDHVLASVLGVRVEGTRLAVFAVGSFLAAIAAALLAFDTGMNPNAGFSIVLIAAVACIMGGLHHFMAPALGGILLGVIQSMVVWRTSAQWESAVTFSILIGFLLFRPQGLVGITKRIEER